MKGLAQIAVTADRKARKGIFPSNDALLTSALKTENYYQRVMWQAVRDMYNGGINSFEFETVMVQLIEGQLRRAWNAGMREIGLDPSVDMTPDFEAELQSIMLNEFEYVPKLVADISEAIALQTNIDPFKIRVEMWAKRYQDTLNQAKIYCAKDNQKYEWIYTPDKDHCRTCLSLNGIVAYAREWEESGLKPQGHNLQCRGFLCGCDLVLTSKRRTSNALGTLLTIAELEEEGVAA